MFILLNENYVGNYDKDLVGQWKQSLVVAPDFGCKIDS